MYEAVYMAATGLRQQQLRLDTIANNVANVNTTGYKATRLDFKDAIYTANSLGPLGTPEENHNKGHGVMPAANNRLYENGAITQTENQLDFALEGEGFIEIEDQTGQILYTRGGNFYLSGLDINEERFLVDSRGCYVRDIEGNRIAFPAGATTLECDQTGRIIFRNGRDEFNDVQLGVYTFPNLNGLEAVGNDNFKVGAASGEKIVATDFSIHQAALESSNVNLAEEMTRMIRAQRAFSLASRALTTADDMEGIANNMRK